ncbi:MAG: cbb3-type cytochrome c oxidase subunit I [Planctomycetes bacterium]|nr:cbb3-type cytochrome c oxidase subunit I [Planctomycetota bacterium]
MAGHTQAAHAGHAHGGGHGEHHGSYLERKGGLIHTIWDWATTVDHKKIGVMYLFAILFMFFLGGVAALAVRFELLEPVRVAADGTISGQFFKPADASSISAGNNIYNRLFTLHGAIMVFMVIVPSVPASLGNFFLPLMIGAKDVAFPRLNLLSWYVYVAGSIFAVSSIILGGVDTGWTFYAPYSTTTDSEMNSKVVFMVMGAFILGFSSILTGLNFIVTVHKLRAPGMGWFDMPLFIWAVYSSAIIQVLATPVIGITLLLLTFERIFRIGIFDPALGGDPVLYQHFFWFYSHPVVYVMILPGMGIISDVLAVQAHKKIFGYRAIAFASLGIAAVSFIVWGHHMFTSMSELASTVFSALTFLVAIPTAVKMFNWIGTLYKSSIALNAPMVYTLIFLFLFAIGGLTGLPLGTLSTDLHLHDSYFVVAHFHYVMMGGTIMALMAGIHHWWPKMFGKMYNDKVAIIAALIVFAGFNLTFMTQFLLGAQGMPRRYASYVDEFQTLHRWSTYGSWLLLVGFLIHLFNFLASLAVGKKAPANPWGGLTLEWVADSPPSEHNFDHEPIVRNGPYDFDTVVPPHWDPKDYPIPAPAAGGRPMIAHSPDKQQ